VAIRSRLQIKDIDQTILKNLSKLQKIGVLTVRPGYEIAQDQLTGKQAIVATVHTKKSLADLPASERLPDKLGKYQVDVREASPYQRLRAYDPAAAAVAETYGRPEEQDPVWGNEREVSTGKLLGAKSSSTNKLFERSKTTKPAAHKALAAHQKKTQIQYSPDKNAPPLERVELTTTIIAHASPDAGFATLSKFLAGTTKSLLIGMYDFTSGPLLNAFLQDLKAPKTLQMVLDSPAPNPTADQTDWITVTELEAALKSRSQIARALVRSDKFASEWMFPYAYHIKVIVRDGKDFWLSSGNLNNSNQPDLTRPPHTEDRDWHVIISDEKLAQTFAYYLNYDFNSATQHQAPDPDAIEKAIEQARSQKASNSNPPPPQPPAPALKNPVAAKTFSNIAVAITPLLTPDKLPDGQGQYLSSIMKLIGEAGESIHIQLQYIESSKGDGSLYNELLQAIADKAAAGVEVRLIESREYGPKWVEKMKAEGVDLTDYIWLQDNVHNKGFVIDSKTVVVSSQNFSPAGIHDNRDAGVIIESPEIAAYFGGIFADDLQNRTIPASKVGSGRKTASPKKAAKKTSAKQVTRKAAPVKTSRKK